MYARILRQLREAKGRSHADEGKEVSTFSARLARPETEERGLSIDDFVTLAEASGEKPGNLLRNSLEAPRHLKPLVGRPACGHGAESPRMIAGRA